MTDETKANWDAVARGLDDSMYFGAALLALADLQREAEEMAKDRERLDWLERQVVQVYDKSLIFGRAPGASDPLRSYIDKTMDLASVGTGEKE